MGEKIEIPLSLHGKIKEKIEGTEFKSVSEYVIFVLMEIITAEEETSKEGESDVKERLRSLGYMD